MAFSKTQLEAAKRRDQALAKDYPRAGRVGRTGRMTRQVDMKAFMNAVDTEGPEVATAAGEGYWRDMDRMYPWIRPEQCGAPRICLAERYKGPVKVRNRFGRVSFRKVYG